MMLLTLHIVAISAVIGITANFAYALGKKDGLRIARNEQDGNQQKELFAKKNS
ncbi:MAG: hypothetical protein H8E38_05845 [SAR324 cluster bacterium]|nr:hypothetical protein [SAR324 cluster bacterium]MBL7034228.1 hypothetical protein [SAR324 cluster bacterium]